MRISSVGASAALLLLLILISCAVPAPATAQVGINIFGLSHHFENDYRSEPHGFNPGLGLHWTFDRGRRTSLDFNAGMYRDSFYHYNSHLSLGARVRMVGPFELGLQVVLARSPSINDGQALLQPVPFVSLRLPRVVFNTIYIPAVGAFNVIPTLALTATVFPFGEPFDWDDPRQQHSHRESSLEFRLFSGELVSGYKDMGVAWRRMFDPQRGLRLGFDLHGTIVSVGDDDLGDYRTRMAVQYLRRGEFDQRHGWFVASGLRWSFEERNGSGTLQTDILVNLGWEYDLGAGFGFFVETGAYLGEVNTTSDGFGGLGGEGTTTSLRADGTTLGLTARL